MDTPRIPRQRPWGEHHRGTGAGGGGHVAAARRGAGANELEIGCPFVLSNSGFSLCLLKGEEATQDVATASGVAGLGLEAATQEQQAALQALFERFDRDELVHAQKGYNRLM